MCGVCVAAGEWIGMGPELVLMMPMIKIWPESQQQERMAAWVVQLGVGERARSGSRCTALLHLRCAQLLGARPHGINTPKTTFHITFHTLRGVPGANLPPPQSASPEESISPGFAETSRQSSHSSAAVAVAFCIISAAAAAAAVQLPHACSPRSTNGARHAPPARGQGGHSYSQYEGDRAGHSDAAGAGGRPRHDLVQVRRGALHRIALARRNKPSSSVVIQDPDGRRKKANVDETVQKLRAAGLDVAGCACHVGSSAQRRQLVQETLRVRGRRQG